MRRHRTSPLRRPLRPALLLLLVTCHRLPGSYALEATWSPNDSDDTGGPLPLSQQRRDQLTQLEHAIRNSPDPQGTLVAAAKSIDMDPQELLHLLERNHRDSQLAMMEARNPRRAQQMYRAVVRATLTLSQWMRTHPRTATLCASLLLASLHVLRTAPTSGTVLSMARRTLVSRGPTTLLPPPHTFVRNNMLPKQQSGSRVLEQWTLEDWNMVMEELPAVEEDGSTWVHPLQPPSSSRDGRKARALQQAAVSQTTVHMDLSSARDQWPDDNNEEDDLYLQEEVAWEQSSWTLRTLSLTERTEDPAVRLVSSLSKEHSRNQQTREHPKHAPAVLVVKGLGDYGRYALVGLTVADCQLDHEAEDHDDELTLSLSTWKGSHFDGRIHVSVTRSPAQANGIVVQVFFLVPKGGVRIPKQAALSIVRVLSDSIAESIRIRTQQTLARRRQSSSFSRAARESAQKRRKTRQLKEQLMEEMATDRRRRWQRSNPNTGHYRPSGKRQQSPNNAVYY